LPKQPGSDGLSLRATVELFAVLVECLRHFEMVLKDWAGKTLPALVSRPVASELQCGSPAMKVAKLLDRGRLGPGRHE
jgi:hypothetical protein